MKIGHLTLKVFALIILNDLGDTIAQALMKKGLALTGITQVTMSNLAEFVSKGVSSPLLWLGILIYALNFFVWIVILYKIDISIAMPVGSFCYIFVPITAIVFFHERIDPLRWLGIICILLGVHFVSQSKPPDPSGGPGCD
ncbi:MAG: EamA family transporter [Candidatus Omnitrophica bacterium]|nr:EamA family transporter [Candidatus Omnitrophota bacterium]